MLRVVQPPAQLHGFGHMVCAGVRGARQVGNGAGHPQGAVGAAGRPAQPVGCALQELQGVVLQHHQLVHALALQRLVGVALPRQREGPGALHPLAHGGAGLSRRGAHQLFGGQGGHLHMQVDAVR